jgi:hypothetical protein
MLRSTRILVSGAVALCLGAGLFSARIRPDEAGQEAEAAGRPPSLLDQLYKENKYFELRDALAGAKGTLGPESEFFRGAVDEVFNRLGSAIAHLRTYLDGERSGGGDRPLAKEAWVLLADAYRRSGLYRQSAEVQRLILERYGNVLDAEERTNRESQSALWSALADSPPQTVELPGEVVIPMESRHFPVAIDGHDFYFTYDTGSSLSVLYRSAAEELGLVSRGHGIKVESGTGRWIDAQVVAVPEIRLGRAVVRNAAFLVLPDDNFRTRRVREGVERRGLIGAPVLTALKEITETRDGRFLVPASPRPRPVQNMFFFGNKPVAEILHRGARLRCFVDTGSSRTFLYPPFFRRYQEEIRTRSKAVPVKMGSVGGETTVMMHVLDEFAFRAGGWDLVLGKVYVHTETTHSITDIIDGTIGLDVLTQASRMTLNFESMSFILE